MMLQTILVSLLLLPIYSISQKSIKDEPLQKYSYIVYGIASDGAQLTGTCFFIKRGINTYLVSAGHIFNGHNIINCQPNGYPHPDTMKVVIDNTIFAIGTSEFQKTECHAYYEYPDLFVYKMPRKIRVNTIEKFVNHADTFPTKNMTDIVSFGYYRYEERIPNVKYPFNLKTTKSIVTLKCNPNKPLHITDINLYDSINYVIGTENTNLGPGYSGAPIFYTSNNKVFFAGVCTSGIKKDEFADIIKPIFILKGLNKK